MLDMTLGISGRRVDLLHEGDLGEGDHNFSWEASTAGVYFAVLKAGADVRVSKIVCLK
jgi:hypothetical protein